jgi:hypothetical protein
MFLAGKYYFNRNENNQTNIKNYLLELKRSFKKLKRSFKSIRQKKVSEVFKSE